jgi:hypothetical protein
MSGASLRLFLQKQVGPPTRHQNRSLAELNEDFGGAVFAKKNHFERNKFNSNSFLKQVNYFFRKLSQFFLKTLALCSFGLKFCKHKRNICAMYLQICIFEQKYPKCLLALTSHLPIITKRNSVFPLFRVPKVMPY